MPDNMSQTPLPSPDVRVSPLLESSFLKACRREPTAVTPIWLMRQAGRYMAEYRAIRAKVPFLELCKRPELAAEVTVTAATVLGVDAAILFADILLILEPLGFDLEFAKGEGPVIHNPVRSVGDVDRVRPLEEIGPLEFVTEAVRLIREALPADIPLIGFAGAPFTVACYAIEGGGSRHYEQAKAFMYRETASWNALLERLVDSTALYLNAQVAAGRRRFRSSIAGWARSARTTMRGLFSRTWRRFLRNLIRGCPSFTSEPGRQRCSSFSATPAARLSVWTGGWSWMKRGGGWDRAWPCRGTLIRWSCWGREKRLRIRRGGFWRRRGEGPVTSSI